MPSLSVEQVEARLRSVGCAICKANTFAIDLRSMQVDGEWKGGGYGMVSADPARCALSAESDSLPRVSAAGSR